MISGLRLGGGERIGIVSAALVLIGGLLPWASVTFPLHGTYFRWGFEADGFMTMILSLMSLAVIAVSKRLVLKRVGVASIGALITFIALFNYLSVTTIMVESAPMKPGVGLVMSLVGGLGLLVSIVRMREHVKEPLPTEDFSNETAT